MPGHHEAIVEARHGGKSRSVRGDEHRRHGRRGGETLDAGGAALAVTVVVPVAGTVELVVQGGGYDSLAMIGVHRGRFSARGTSASVGGVRRVIHLRRSGGERRQRRRKTEDQREHNRHDATDQPE